MSYCRAKRNAPVAILLPIVSFLFITLLHPTSTTFAFGDAQNGATAGGTIPDTEADLTIIQTESIDPVRVSGALRYTIFVSNSGPSQATNVRLDNALPPEITLVATNGCENDPIGTPICLLGTLAAGASVQVTVDVLINQNAIGPIVKQATVSSDISDPESENNTATEITTVFATPSETPFPVNTATPVASVAVTNRSSGASNAPLGKQISFTVRVTNSGSAVITTLPLTYTYPSAIFRYDSATVAPDDTVNDGQLNWRNLHNLGLGPGESSEIVLEFTLLADTAQLPGGQATTNAESLRGESEDAYVSTFGASTIVLTARTVQIGSSISGSVAKLQWATADEKAVEGYHIWQQIGEGKRLRETQAMIPANLSGQTGSASYRREYPFSAATEPTTYLLEIVLLSGIVEFREVGTIFQAPESAPTPTPIPTQPGQPSQPDPSIGSQIGIFLPLITR